MGKNGSLGDFVHFVNITQRLYVDLNGIAYYILRLHAWCSLALRDDLLYCYTSEIEKYNLKNN